MKTNCLLEFKGSLGSEIYEFFKEFDMIAIIFEISNERKAAVLSFFLTKDPRGWFKQNLTEIERKNYKTIAENMIDNFKCDYTMLDEFHAMTQKLYESALFSQLVYV